MERVRLYLIDRYNNNADIKPTRPPCAQLKLRRDFKCLTEEERQKFIDIVKRLYLDGSIDELADLHTRYWQIVHRGPEFSPWHRYLVYQLEKKVAAIDPNVTVPYWADIYDFWSPEKSLIFKYFGTSGEHVNGFCVRDGMYADLNLTRCVRRQWYDSKLPPLESPEMVTSWIQRSRDYITGVGIMSGIHFVPHLAVGGYAGDMSVETAAHEEDHFLTPLTYNLMSHPDPTGKIVTSNIATDVLTHWTDVSVAETFHMGFGDMCSVTDRLIVAINKHLNGERPVLPTAVQDMPSIPKSWFFPNFESGNYSWFDFEMDNVGDECNQLCKPVPKFESYMDTPHGMRMLRTYDINANPLSINGLTLSQSYMYLLTDALNIMNYCSPYIP